MTTSKKFTLSTGLNYAVVKIQFENLLITDVWQGSFGSQTNFRNVLTYIAEQIEEHHIKFWLADLREMEGSFDSSRVWLSNELMPRVIGAGLQKEAVVLPKNAFSRLSAQDAILRIQNFELRQFANVDEAIAWLGLF